MPAQPAVDSRASFKAIHDLKFERPALMGFQDRGELLNSQRDAVNDQPDAALAVGSVAGLVLRQGGSWMAIGLAIGAVGIFVAAKLVSSQLTGVPPFDPFTIGAAVLVLLVCAGVALLVPVRRATRVDPISVLR